MQRSDLVVGHCPGALRPMRSGDGLIIRIRPRLSKVSLSQLEALATASIRFGDGNLCLSNRANVQIRAVTPEDHGAALALLLKANLVDSDAGVEAVRNIMVAPALEPRGIALAAGLERVLAETKELRSLPGKFGVGVQGGQHIDPAYVSDLTFLVRQDGILILLEGVPDRAGLFKDAEGAIAGFVSAAKAFLCFCRDRPSIRRMREAVREFGSQAVLEVARLSPLVQAPTQLHRPAPIGELGDLFGIGFVFGELTPVAVGEIINVMRQEGLTEVELTPHRALVFPNAKPSRAALLKIATSIGGIIDPTDIRLRIHACVGAPACSRATVATRRDAALVLCALDAVTLSQGGLHISGCEKKCAHRGEADITAIGNNGRYEVFGPALSKRSNVTPAELPAAIAQIARAL
jgi:precorrin-3B synthase